jgi:hypothetical protein
LLTFLLIDHLIKGLEDGSSERIENEYGSFAKTRANVECYSFVDGHDFFRAAFHALALAKHEIFITGW